MAEYVKTVWQSGVTPCDAAEMNNLETQYDKIKSETLTLAGVKTFGSKPILPATAPSGNEAVSYANMVVQVPALAVLNNQVHASIASETDFITLAVPQVGGILEWIIQATIPAHGGFGWGLTYKLYNPTPALVTAYGVVLSGSSAGASIQPLAANSVTLTGSTTVQTTCEIHVKLKPAAIGNYKISYQASDAGAGITGAATGTWTP